MYNISEPTIPALFDKQRGSGSENVGGIGDDKNSTRHERRRIVI